MTPTEASDLLTRCAAFDNRGASAAAAIAWASALKDVPLDEDAFAAVDRYYGTTVTKAGEKLWIQPHNVRAHRLAIRKERLGETLPAYEPVQGETGSEFIRRRRAQLDAVATGRAVGRPVGQLTGPPHPSVALKLEGAFRGRISLEADPEPAPSLADEVRRAGPLGIVCPKCNAAIGRPCHRSTSSDKQPIGKPRATPHADRETAASGQYVPTAEERRQQEERQREASRRALERLQAEPASPDPETTDIEGEAS